MAELALSQGKVALVDDEDLPLLSGYSWCASRNKHLWYAKGSRQGLKIPLHRLVLNAPHGMYVDHIDGDGLNNCKSNLRLCTQQQNLANQRVSSRNASGYKGVSWYKRCARWHAYIKHNRRFISLGYFQTAESAARAYDEKALELYGSFARCNFPPTINNSSED